MPIHNLLLVAFALLVFSSLALIFVPLALKPGKEAQRALEVVSRATPQNNLLARKKQLLSGILSAVHEVRSRWRLTPSEKSTQRLAKAGYWDRSATDYYFAAQFIFPIGFAWIGSLVHANTLYWILASSLAGLFIPKCWLARSISTRRERIRRGLPDAIDLLVICVDAGLGLDQAVLRVSGELTHSHPDLNEELHRVHLEQRAGRPRRESWQNLADRTSLPEVASFVSLLIQADRFGTQVTKALSTFADDIRQQQRQRAEEAAAALKVKIIFPLVVFIFPCLIIVLLGPAVLNITHDLHALLK